MIKKYRKIWDEIKINDHIRIKISSNDALPWNKSLIMFDVLILTKSVFQDGSQYYTQLDLEKFWYGLPQYYWQSSL